VCINEAGGQGAVAGLVRDTPNNLDDFWREISDGREAPDKKAALRQLLQEELGVRFNPDLPLIVHFIDYHLEFGDVVRGLLALAPAANLLVKDIKWHHIDVGDLEAELKHPNIFITNQHTAKLNHIIRFAADVLLTSCFSGFCSTSFMLGFKIIPVCTRHIYPWQTFAQKKHASFAAQMRQAAVPMPLKVMDYISPINMDAPDMLAERVNDADYWRRYEEKLPQFQKDSFGRYWVDEAALGRINLFVRRLIETGSFVPEGAALRPIGSHPLAAMPEGVL
jgi:hypothetical protein